MRRYSLALGLQVIEVTPVFDLLKRAQDSVQKFIGRPNTLTVRQEVQLAVAETIELSFGRSLGRLFGKKL